MDLSESVRSGEGDEEELSELEKSVAAEEQHTFGAGNNAGIEEIDIDPIVKQFGSDGGVINVTVKDNENFFFVQTEGIATAENSYFEMLGHTWQGIKVLPPRFDAEGVMLESDVNDPDAIYAELYVPKEVAESDEFMYEAFGIRAINAICELYFPDARNNTPWSNGVQTTPLKSPTKVPPAAQSKAASKPQNLASDKVSANDNQENVSLASLQDALKNIPKKVDEEKKKTDLAGLVFKMTDPNLPAKPVVTLTLSDPILPAIAGMSKLERRLTPTGWKLLKRDRYALSIDQGKEFNKMSNLGSDTDEDILYSNLTPSLGLALKQLITKNSEFHLPLMAMFDLLWSHQSSNDSDYGVKINTVGEAQQLLDKLFVFCQDQVQTKLLLDYQLKLQLANIMAGSTKDKTTHKAVLEKVQHNMDHAGKPSFAGVAKTVKALTSTKKTLTRGGFTFDNRKRPGGELSLTASTPNKRPKTHKVSVSNNYSHYNHNAQVAGRGRGNFTNPRGGGGRGSHYNNNNGGFTSHGGGRGGQRGHRGGGGRGGNRGGRGRGAPRGAPRNGGHQ